MHQRRGDGDVRDLPPADRPARARNERDNRHQRRDERKPDEQELERRCIGQPVLRGDEAGAP